jgi:hypothetical protein
MIVLGRLIRCSDGELARLCNDFGQSNINFLVLRHMVRGGWLRQDIFTLTLLGFVLFPPFTVSLTVFTGLKFGPPFFTTSGISSK